MGKIILALICLFFTAVGVFALAVAFTDVFVKFRRRKNKRRIVGFRDINSWKQALLGCAKGWSKKMPTVPLTDNSRFVLLDMLKKQYKHSSVQGWQYAQLLYGLKAAEPDFVPGSINDFSISEIDEGFLIYKLRKAGFLNDAQVEEKMQAYLPLLSSKTRENGLVEYRKGYGDICLVDTLAFVCPLMFSYGVQKKDERLIKNAFLQIESYHNSAYIKEFGLYAHGYDSVKKTPCESIGWGRGTGWYLFGILDSYNELTADYEEKKLLLEYIKEALENIVSFRREDGGWSTQLVSKSNYDSSATAMFALFILKASVLLNVWDDYRDIVLGAIKKLMSVTTPDGQLEYCEGDCHGIGRYSKLYSVSPFAQGAALELISAYEKAMEQDNNG